MEYEIYHAGIKGMKWGVRRYQNADGSLTAAGKSRYYKEADAAGYKDESYSGRRYKSGKGGKKEGYDADPNKWVMDDLGTGRKIADEGSTMANKLKKMNDDSIRNRKVKPMDLSNMSDKEMRDQINRAMLEKQYNDMFNPEKTANGREHVGRVIETVGSVLTIGASALAITMGILELKDKIGSSKG